MAQQSAMLDLTPSQVKPWWVRGHPLKWGWSVLAFSPQSSEYPLHEPANNAEEKEDPENVVLRSQQWDAGSWLHAQPHSGGLRASSQDQSQLVFICTGRWQPHGKICFMA